VPRAPAGGDGRRALGGVGGRLSVSTTRTTASAAARRGQMLTGTGARAANSAPVSQAPVRSSATMVSGRVRVGFIEVPRI
jgi:hypothetical protein